MITLIVVLGAALWAGAGGALAATSSATAQASNVKNTSATVSGTVIAGDGETAYYFEYGPNVAYGSMTSVKAATQGSATVTATLTGLKASTTYHYQLVAEDGAVEPATAVNGGDGTFTTSATAILPGTAGPTAEAITGPATSVTTTGATLTGLVSTSGGGEYVFEYGTTTSYGYFTSGTTGAAGTISASASVTSLQPSTTYHFRLVALGTSSVSAQQDALGLGADVTFTTAAVGTGTSPGTGTSGKSGTGTAKAKYGTVGLRTNRLPVSGSKVTLSLHCSGPASAHCAGQAVISVGKAKCGTATFSTAAHQNFSASATLSSACTAKLSAARKGRLTASLKATFSTHQAALTRSVILVKKS